MVPPIYVYTYRHPSILNHADEDYARRKSYPNKLPVSFTTPEGEVIEDMYALTNAELEAIHFYGPIEVPQASFYEVETSRWIDVDYDPRFQYYEWEDDLGDNYGFVYENYGGVNLDYYNYAYNLTETVEYLQLREDSNSDIGLYTRLTRFETDLNRALANGGSWGKFVLDSYVKLYEYEGVSAEIRSFLDTKARQFSIGALIDKPFNPSASDLDGEEQFTFSLYENGPVEKKPTLTMCLNGKYSFIQSSETPTGKTIAFFVDSDCTTRFEDNVDVVTNEVVGTTVTSIRVIPRKNYPRTLYYQSVDGSVSGGIINVVDF